MVDNDSVAALREALRHSPDNLVLRKLLAEQLMGLGRFDEAEQAYREALALAGDDADLKLGLAGAFQRQGKHREGLVLVEALLAAPPASPRCHLLAARLLLQAGEPARAVEHYRMAVGLDASLADDELAERLGVGAGQDAPVVDGRVRAAPELADDMALTEPERPQVTFAEVGGMEPVKEEIRMKVIYPLRHADLFRAYDKPIGGGLLLYGPPGCGKTHLARATAGEIDAAFIAVGIDQVLDMWIGRSERNLHDVFQQARLLRPCVLFFDEVDALGARRSDMRASARQVVNQFLAELDGVSTSNEGVLILAATNAPWHIDPAFRRPGRFDRLLFVPPPDPPARAAVLRVHCRGKPLAEVDFDHVAGRTADYSGADLKAVVDGAVEAKLREAMRTGVPAPLTTKDLLAAAKRLRPSTREWFATARNYATYANDAGTYDDVLAYLERRR